ncbi:hypothetical protein VNO78_06917 [Psophocarpus tetragonolobus]|uniref:Uncharacterized protein n=1 Tax=Psophocarpus tetragonolobus TaxID=3891 RepID=A0AAN9XSH2_PSOTE
MHFLSISFSLVPRLLSCEPFFSIPLSNPSTISFHLILICSAPPLLRTLLLHPSIQPFHYHPLFTSTTSAANQMGLRSSFLLHLHEVQNGSTQHLQVETEMRSFLCQQRTREDCLFSTWNPLPGVLCTEHSAWDNVKLLNVNGENPDDKRRFFQANVFSFNHMSTQNNTSPLFLEFSPSKLYKLNPFIIFSEVKSSVSLKRLNQWIVDPPYFT